MSQSASDAYLEFCAEKGFVPSDELRLVFTFGWHRGYLDASAADNLREFIEHKSTPDSPYIRLIS